MYEIIVHAAAMSEQHNLFDRLGGIRPMADLLEKPPSTIQSWKNVGRIPAQEQPEVLEKANAAGFEITAEDVVFPMGKPDADAPVEADAA